jgi:hypothetical protein
MLLRLLLYAVRLIRSQTEVWGSEIDAPSLNWMGRT